MARILFVSHTSDLSGSSYSLLKLLNYIRREHEAAVVAPGDGELFKRLQQIGVAGHNVRSDGLTRRCIPEVYRLITHGRFDLVYGNNFSSGPRNALIAAKLAGKPFVWHIREMLWEAKWRTAFFLRYANAIIAVSQACAQAVEKHVLRKDVHVVYNGVDLQDFRLTRDEAKDYVHSALSLPEEWRVITSVGHIHARKGPDYALKAVASLVRDSPRTVLCFLGSLDVDPTYVCQLREMISLLGLEKNVRLLGFRNDVLNFLQGSDVFVHPTLRDANPRAVLEAMASRLPVVAFDVDGVSEMVVHGETGYLVPLGDVTGMAAALKELLSNPSLRARMGQRGRERVEAMFTAEETAKQVETIIARVLQRDKQRSNAR